jgi:phosphatidylcholine synthase
VAGAWLVHAYTASGALLAFLALTCISRGLYAIAFAWLGAAVLVDATDGALARRVNVASKLPHFDGAKLDDIVDYLTYVFVPAFFVWHAQLLMPAWRVPVAAAMLVSSAYGFNRDDAKTADHSFTGFPSYWNIVVFYLFIARWPPLLNAAILLAAAALVFVPIRYVHPSRTAEWRTPTMVLGALWGGLVGVMLWQMPDVSSTLFWISLAFPAYYTILSFVLDLRRAR